jgi:potassium efflux system protein
MTRIASLTHAPSPGREPVTRRDGLLLLILLSLSLLVHLSVAAAASDSENAQFSPEAARQMLDRVARDVIEGKPDEVEVNQAIRDVTLLRTEAKRCITTAGNEIAHITDSINAIEGSPKPAKPDSPVEGGSATEAGSSTPRVALTDELIVELSRLRKQKTVQETRLAECRLLAVRADDTLARLAQIQKGLLKKSLLEREDDIVTLLVVTLRNPEILWPALQQFVLDTSGIQELAGAQLPVLAIIVAVAFAIGATARPALMRRAAARPDDTFNRRLTRTLIICVCHYLPSLIATTGAFAYLWFIFRGDHPFHTPVLLVSVGLLAWLTALTVIRTLLWPVAPATLFTPLPDELARDMARRLMVLALLLFVGFLIVLTVFSTPLPESVYALARSIYISTLVVNLWWLLWLVGRIPTLKGSGKWRTVLLLLLAVALGAELLGYHNLSSRLLISIVGTLLAAIGFWILFHLSDDFFDRLEGVHYAWQKRLRATLGLSPQEPVPGLIWIRLLTDIVLWISAAVVVLMAWGLSEAGLTQINSYLLDGFTIADLHIVPSKLLAGLFLFAVLLTLVRWFKDKLDRVLQMRTQLDIGARDALVSIIGYIGYTLAILIALSLAGLDLSKVAIIAGALSVGIGFGLQNVVNNFVSGIILLFERPIRPGDWIVIGNTEGFVKKVRVRATEIQTFDRSEVIVPNSQLISEQVTNWTFRDRHCRVILPIGVAYGSNLALVQKILLDVARAQPMVITSGYVTPPKALFTGFGDSALTFELRVYIQDARTRFDVISELFIAIDGEFRKHGVEIPFPQRDLHFRGPWPPGTK